MLSLACAWSPQKGEDADLTPLGLTSWGRENYEVWVLSLLLVEDRRLPESEEDGTKRM